MLLMYMLGTNSKSELPALDSIDDRGKMKKTKQNKKKYEITIATSLR